MICFYRQGAFWNRVNYLYIAMFYQLFLESLWILTAPIHCKGSIGEQVMKCYISPNLLKKMKKQTPELRNFEFIAFMELYLNKLNLAIAICF